MDNTNIIMHAIAGVTRTLREQNSMTKEASAVEELQKQAELAQLNALAAQRVAQIEALYQGR